MTKETPKKPAQSMAELYENDSVFRTIGDFFNNKIPGHQLDTSSPFFGDDSLMYFYAYKGMGMLDKLPAEHDFTAVKSMAEDMFRRKLISEEVKAGIMADVEKVLARLGEKK